MKEKRGKKKPQKKASCFCGEKFNPKKDHPTIGGFGFCSVGCWNDFQQILGEGSVLKAMPKGRTGLRVEEIEELARQTEGFLQGRKGEARKGEASKAPPKHLEHPSRKNPPPPEHPAVRLERLRGNPPKAPPSDPRVVPDMTYGQRYAAWVDAVKDAERDLANYQRGVEDQKRLTVEEGRCPSCGRGGRTKGVKKP